MSRNWIESKRNHRKLSNRKNHDLIEDALSKQLFVGESIENQLRINWDQLISIENQLRINWDQLSKQLFVGESIRFSFEQLKVAYDWLQIFSNCHSDETYLILDLTRWKLQSEGGWGGGGGEEGGLGKGSSELYSFSPSLGLVGLGQEWASSCCKLGVRGFNKSKCQNNHKGIIWQDA